MFIFCACVCALIQTEPPFGVLRALLQPCFSLGICHGARINKHRWRKEISLLFVNGQIITKFQSIYHHRQGKTLLNFTVRLVICATTISFTAYSLNPSSFVQRVRDMWNHMLQFVWLCRIVSSLNTPRHRWKYLAVGFFLFLPLPPLPPFAS